MRLLRVFPRRTHATPQDGLSFVGMPSLGDLSTESDEVHVSVSFTWDKSLAEAIAERWRGVRPGIIHANTPVRRKRTRLLPMLSSQQPSFLGATE